VPRHEDHEAREKAADREGAGGIARAVPIEVRARVPLLQDADESARDRPAVRREDDAPDLPAEPENDVRQIEGLAGPDLEGLATPFEVRIGREADPSWVS
jgi:hypothetical protein